MPSKRDWVIGTSGHIDHGKSTLVRALTGIDPDRLAEEKARGITIDLGFAHYQTEDGVRLAFVDVPGHEKFIHNMLAGAAGLDAVLLVVAADEGVMPQTREHLQICQLLGVACGLVVLTRIDKVEDRTLLELCQAEVEDLVRGTFLASAPILPVSALTGEGLEALKSALIQLSQQLTPRETEKPFRLSVDRSFTLKGFGTIVTGTVLQGSWQGELELWQYPAERPVRLRGLQVHGEAVSKIEAGQRAALNLAHLTKNEIKRGDQLAAPHCLLTSYLLNAELQLLPQAPRPLKNRERLRLYLGTQEVLARLILLEAEILEPGKRQMVQWRLEAPVSSRWGDAFIVRSFSPMYTLGGGHVIDPAPHKSRRLQGELRNRLPKLWHGQEPIRLEEVIYLQALRGVSFWELSARLGMGEKAIHRCLSGLLSSGKIVGLAGEEKRYWHAEHLRRIGTLILRILQQFHQKYPERQGLSTAELAGKLAWFLSQESQVEALLKFLGRLHLLAETKGVYHVPGHQANLSSLQETALRLCLEAITEGQSQPLHQIPLLEKLGIDPKLGEATLKRAIHQKLLVRVAPDLFYPPAQLKAIETKLREHFARFSQLTVIEFKELLGVGRKHAIELLEYFDAQRVTFRHENHRTLRK